MVVCEICKKELKAVTWRHLKCAHGIELSIYREKFPNSKINGMLGRHQSDFQKLRACQAHKGKTLSEEHKKSMYHSKESDPDWYENVVKSIHNGNPSARAKKSWITKHINGTDINMGKTYSISGYRKDLNQFFRSTWEANFARILNYIGIEWLYEPKRFRLEECSYLPDFYIPKYDCYIEIKGRVGNDKPEQMRRLYPYESLYVIGSEVYAVLKAEYQRVIPNWENGRPRSKGEVMSKCV